MFEQKNETSKQGTKMDDSFKLKCSICNSILKLTVSYSGCDWDSEKGEGSGFNTEISLICTNDKCRLVFGIGHVKDFTDFSPVIDKLKPYVS